MSQVLRILEWLVISALPGDLAACATPAQLFDELRRWSCERTRLVNVLNVYRALHEYMLRYHESCTAAVATVMWRLGDAALGLVGSMDDLCDAWATAQRIAVPDLLQFACFEASLTLPEEAFLDADTWQQRWLCEPDATEALASELRMRAHASCTLLQLSGAEQRSFLLLLHEHVQHSMLARRAARFVSAVPGMGTRCMLAIAHSVRCSSAAALRPARRSARSPAPDMRAAHMLRARARAAAQVVDMPPLGADAEPALSEHSGIVECDDAGDDLSRADDANVKNTRIWTGPVRTCARQGCAASAAAAARRRCD